MKLVARPVRAIRPNPWNPNRMSDRQYRAIVNSIRVHGFITPVVTRKASKITNDGINTIYERLKTHSIIISPGEMAHATEEIIDGEHRWLAAQELYLKINNGDLRVVGGAVNDKHGWVKPDGKPLSKDEIAEGAVNTFVRDGNIVIPTVDLGKITLTEAKRLTIVLNETRGNPDAKALGRLLKELTQALGVDKLEDMPWDREQIMDFIEVGEFDWESFEEARESAGKTIEENLEPDQAWVTIVLSFDPEEMEIWNQAKAIVQENLQVEGIELNKRPEIANGQVLEAICADYLAGA